MTKITVICREDGYEHVLIYVVNVADPASRAEVRKAVQKERDSDLGADVTSDMEIFHGKATSGRPLQHVVLPEWVLARSGIGGAIDRKAT